MYICHQIWSYGMYDDALSRYQLEPFRVKWKWPQCFTTHCIATNLYSSVYGCSSSRRPYNLRLPASDDAESVNFLGPNRTLLKYVVAALPVHDFERFQVDPGTIAGLHNIRGASIPDLIIILCRNELLPRAFSISAL